LKHDGWLAYQFDMAVTIGGGALEAALLETENVGTEREPKTVKKYRLAELLDPAFRLPRPGAAEPVDIKDLRGIAGLVVD
jgi:hypothetical protein